MGYLDQQTRAFATTWRYMIAGAGVYGTLSMIKNLGQFQAQLGEISAIATGPNGLPIVGSQLDQLGTKLLDVSNKTTQPIADLQTGVLNLYSTIGDVPPNEAANMMETISNVSITAQSNINDTTQALLGMLNAFSRGTKELPAFGDEFFKVIQESAGMPGSIYAQKLGVLSSSAALGHFTPEQMGALAIGATRSGGSAATNMQYLAQMMMFLMHPVGKKQSAALAGIGLGPQERQRLGGYETLKRFLTEVNRQGGVGLTPGLAHASDEMLQNITDQGLTAQQAGMSGGGTRLISEAFGRIQSQRVAAILSKLMTPDQVAGTENKTLDQYLADVTSSAGEVDKAMDRAMDYRRIQQAGNALHNMGIEFATLASPLLNPIAQYGITWPIEHFNNQNPWAQRGEAAGGILGAAALLKILRGRGGGVSAGGLVRGAGIGMAGVDALTSTVRGETPMKPIYVAVVYSMAGGMGFSRGTNPYGIPGRDMRTVPGETGMPEGGRNTYRASRLSRLGRGLMPLASFLGPEALAATAAVTLVSEGHTTQHGLHRYSGSGGWGHLWHDIAGGGGDENQTLAKYGFYGPDAQKNALSRISGVDNQGNVRVKGKAEVTVNLDQLVDGQTKRTSKKVSVDLFPDFTSGAPQERGRPKTRRAG